MSLTTGCLTGSTHMRCSVLPTRSAGMSAHSTAFFRGTRSLHFRPCKPSSQQYTSTRTQITRALGDEGELLPDVEEGAKVRVTKEVQPSLVFFGCFASWVILRSKNSVVILTCKAQTLFQSALALPSHPSCLMSDVRHNNEENPTCRVSVANC